MLVDAAGGFLSQRVLPRMALLGVLAYEPGLVIEAEGMSTLVVAKPGAAAPRLPVTIWKDQCEAVWCGENASAWMSAFLGRECRMVYAADDLLRPIDPTYAESGERVGFADGFPLLVIGQGSLDDLNAQLDAGDAPAVPMNRFRPNLVAAGFAGYAEDEWRRIVVGDADGASVYLDLVKPCARCSIVPVDQATGVRGTERLSTLATYRRRGGGVHFGQNAIHRGVGTLRVGDPVRLVR